jgi:hypothetical protein
VRNGRRIRVGDREVRLHEVYPLDQESHRFETGHAECRWVVLDIRKRQRWHAPGRLAGDADQFSASCQHVHLPARP